jgi:TetR/AcrR family transcriptional regulator, cholesterol catabolism regulator
MARIRNKKNETRKEVITAAAARLFREKGYSATGMRDLAGEVGVEAASLYNHIRSKAELLQEICFRTANLFTAQLNELENDVRLTSLEKVESILRSHIRMWVKCPDDMLVMNNEARYLEEPYLATFLNERRLYVRRLEAIMEDGVRKGEIRPMETYTAVLTLMSVVRGIEFWHRTKKNISAESLEENMVTHYTEGLRKA